MRKIFCIIIILGCFYAFSCTKNKNENISVHETVNEVENDFEENEIIFELDNVQFEYITDHGLFGIYNGSFKGNDDFNTSYFVFTDNNYEANIYFDENQIPSSIDENELIYHNAAWKYIEKGTFQIKCYNGIYYIEWQDSKLFSTYGILFNEIQMALYLDNDIIFYPGINSKMANVFPYVTNLNTTSELVKGNINYPAKNMLSKKTLPWIEKDNDNSQGEKIKIEIYQYMGLGNLNPEISLYPFTGFVISNGYIDFLKPNVYKNYSRVKTIEVISFTGVGEEYILNDNSLFQSIILPENMLPNQKECEYKILIKDVYKGERWDNISINIFDVIQPFLREEIK